jgi:hypothetical protein
MGVKGWLRPHRYLLLLLLAVTCVPAAALFWVSSRLLEQDRALAVQRLQERLEHAADVATSVLHRRLSDIEAQLPLLAAAPPTSLPPDAVVVISMRDTIHVEPAAHLLWQPAVPPWREPPATVWQRGERLEFQHRDYTGAAAFRRLATAREPEMRAGALVRLARTLRKARRHKEALAAYDELRQLAATRVGGTPSDLVADHGRVLVLRERDGDVAGATWRDHAAAASVD